MSHSEVPAEAKADTPDTSAHVSANGEPAPRFADLALPAPLTRALDELGYERPTPIQARALPPLLAGQDLLGRAPTGTGKTAAFALPALAGLAPPTRHVQVLVLTPTRELAIQVAEAFTSYARHVPDFRVLPIYGGQDYAPQIRALSRGVHVVVGTPGRIMDHLKRGTLLLDTLRLLVLDEADEMLRMGFIDDVDTILESTPATRQSALFSATMPKPIERIARRHLKSPVEISIENRRESATTIRQRVWRVAGMPKLEALTRLLEVERFDAMLVFVRTRTATVELAEKLSARGMAAAALNGDMVQKERERIVERLRNGSIDVLVATDVVARGLDVERISHVVNYDIPYDVEAYVHRIGRTGRAGRSGDAILFVVPRERHLLGAIERATGNRIEPLTLPSVAAVSERRIERFHEEIDAMLALGGHDRLQTVLERFAAERDLPIERVAAALARMALGERELFAKEARGERGAQPDRSKGDSRTANRERVQASPPHPSPSAAERPARPERPAPRSASTTAPTTATERFRVEVGREHGATAAHLVGAIANEAGIPGSSIGRIRIEPTHATVELPVGMPKGLLKSLKKTWVLGRRLGIAPMDRAGEGVEANAAPSNRPAARKAVRAGDAPPRKRKDKRPAVRARKG